MTSARAGLCGAVVLLTLAGCKPERTVREQLVEVNQLLVYNELDEARQLLETLYAEHPHDIDVMLDLARFYVDAAELERARTVIERIREMELGTNDARRAESLDRRYVEAVYTLARGEGPANPADNEAYEDALIGLINLDRGSEQERIDEYYQFLLTHARRALGADEETRLDSVDLQASVHQASAAQARVAMLLFERLRGNDPRLEVELTLPSTIRIEINDASAILRWTIFFDDFDTAWREVHEPAFRTAGRYDPESERFTIDYTGPLMEDLLVDTTVERLTGRAQTVYAREIATDLVYELRGFPRGEAEPLPYRLIDFADASARDPLVLPGMQFQFHVEIPWSTIRRGARMLQERIEVEGLPEGVEDADSEADPEDGDEPE